tara:strand:- start:277 stop:693 length:417 start_codon:yes stop_codon:yes gene_type:complete
MIYEYNNKQRRRNKMALTQSEAIQMLVLEMGNADGEYSEQEINEICNNNPVFLKHCNKIDFDLFILKIKQGKATKETAISTLKARSLDTQLDALAIVWHVLLADGIMDDGEKELMVELLTEFDIDIESVTSRLEKITS